MLCAHNGVNKEEWKILSMCELQTIEHIQNKDLYPLPFIDQILDLLEGKEFYTFMDCFTCYNQISLAHEDKLKTNFTIIFNTFV